MKIICCLCGKDLGEKAPFEDKRISHTYCPECHKLMLEEIERLEK